MFWESVLPTTGVIFIVLTLLGFGGYLAVSYDGKVEPMNLRLGIGLTMIAIAVSFIFACFGWAASK